MREKKRYVVYEVISKKPIKKDISDEIIKKIKTFLGIFEGAKAGIIKLTYSTEKQKGIIRINNKFTDKIKTCLALIKTLKRSQVIIRTIYVSGLLNKAQKIMQD